MGNIQKTEGVKTTAPARPAANAGSAEKPQAPATASPPRDVFSREPVPAADLAKAKEAVAALSTVPGIPFNNKAKAEWIESAKAKLKDAEAARQTLSDAWMRGQISMDELSNLEKPYNELADKIESAEMRLGTKPYPGPLNPFRPTMQFTNGAASLANKGGVLGAIVGSLALAPAIAIDTMDLVTRPLQAIAWPFAKLYQGAVVPASRAVLGGS